MRNFRLMTNSSVIDDAEIMHSSDSNFITSADTTIPVVASSLTNPVTSKVTTVYSDDHYYNSSKSDIHVKLLLIVVKICHVIFYCCI